MAKLNKVEILEALKEYGVVTKSDLKGLATKRDLDRLERSLTVKITKSKNDLANRIANVAVAKAERNKLEKLENRVTTLESFQFS